MTKTFASNKYRENGVEHCNDKKSACVSMKGMKIYDNGSAMEDRKCFKQKSLSLTTVIVILTHIQFLKF
jgi:hypothetical protein